MKRQGLFCSTHLNDFYFFSIKVARLAMASSKRPPSF